VKLERAPEKVFIALTPSLSLTFLPEEEDETLNEGALRLRELVEELDRISNGVEHDDGPELGVGSSGRPCVAR
jgi:hypothetical protein